MQIYPELASKDIYVQGGKVLLPNTRIPGLTVLSFKNNSGLSYQFIITKSKLAKKRSFKENK